MVPAFTVFQTPPEPTATYQVLGSVGSIAMSAIRPDMSAGPMARSFRPSNAFAADVHRVGLGRLRRRRLAGGEGRQRDERGGGDGGEETNVHGGPPSLEIPWCWGCRAQLPALAG